MPENARMGNMLFDRKCSKCKKVQQPLNFKTGNKVYMTCNTCRFKAYQRTHPLNTLFDFHRGQRTVNMSTYFDTDSEQESPQIPDVMVVPLLLSSSAAAAACSADCYFVEEPEPEPEP